MPEGQCGVGLGSSMCLLIHPPPCYVYRRRGHTSKVISSLSAQSHGHSLHFVIWNPWVWLGFSQKACPSHYFCPGLCSSHPRTLPVNTSLPSELTFLRACVFSPGLLCPTPKSITAARVSEHEMTSWSCLSLSQQKKSTL